MWIEREIYHSQFQYRRINRHVTTIISVDGKDLTKYLKDEGYDVEWYDLSLESGRNAKGDMHYNPVAEKYKIILHTRPMSGEELIEFFSTIKILKTLSVTFFNPYTGQQMTTDCYRGDRKITMKWNRNDKGILYNTTDISLIEL